MKQQDPVNFKDVIEEVLDVKSVASTHARRMYKFLAFRDFEIRPIPNLDDGSPHEVERLTQKELRAYCATLPADAEGFSIDVAYDGSDYMAGFVDGDYDPRCTEGSVEVRFNGGVITAFSEDH